MSADSHEIQPVDLDCLNELLHISLIPSIEVQLVPFESSGEPRLWERWISINLFREVFDSGLNAARRDTQLFGDQKVVLAMIF